MSVTLTVLGCSDAFNAGGNRNTAFLLRTESQLLLLDCGANTLAALKERKLSGGDIDVVLLSHFHGDHMAGVPFLLMDAARLKREKPLHIFSPEGGKKIIGELLQLCYPGMASILDTLPLHWHTYSEGKTIQEAGLELQAWPMIHTPEAKPHALRFTAGGRTIAFSGDTGWTPLLYEVAAFADLFICECTFFKTEQKNHINYVTLETHRAGLTCRRLLLTHFDEEMLANGAQVAEEMAVDGLEVMLVEELRG